MPLRVGVLLAVFHRRVRRAHCGRSGRVAPGDLSEGPRGGPRLHPTQDLGPGGVLPRDHQRGVGSSVSFQVSQQAQPSVHESQADARGAGGGH